jgi:hypothetical protein
VGVAISISDSLCAITYEPAIELGEAHVAHGIEAANRGTLGRCWGHWRGVHQGTRGLGIWLILTMKVGHHQDLIKM